jgi:hypothetical protein
MNCVPNFGHKMKKFPCYACITRPMCINYVECKFVNKNKIELRKLLDKGICPDCNSREIIIENVFHLKCNSCSHCFTKHGDYYAERFIWI